MPPCIMQDTIQPVGLSACDDSEYMDDLHDGPDQSSSHERIHERTSCRVCGHTIGPRDRRLTWRIRDGEAVFEYHYCSAGCLPNSAPETPRH